MKIPSEIKDLDKILKKCVWRMSNHYSEGEWEKFSKEIAGSDTKNPRFVAYINLLTNEGYIEEARKNEGSGDGYIATAKGLIFIGFEKSYIDNRRGKMWENWKWAINTAVTLIAVYVGVILERYLKEPPEPMKENIVLLPPIQIVHDTVYVKAPKQNQDSAPPH